MPGLFSIDACLVVHRRLEARGEHDPCVWIRDSREGGHENFWHCFYADEVALLLKDLSSIKLDSEESTQTVGALTHESERVHGLTFKAKTSHPDRSTGYVIDWRISIGRFWENFPFEEAIARIEWARVRVGPKQMMPIHPSESWAGEKLLQYFEEWKDRPNRPPHMFLPISIIR